MLLLLSAAQAAVLVVTTADIDDDCCAQKVVSEVGALAFVQAVGVDPTTDRSCVVLEGAPDEAALRAAFSQAGFPVQSIEPAESCPAGTIPRVDPWAQAEGLDAQIVSRGATLALDAVPGKVTIYDFGAPWCGPCVVSAEALKGALRTEPRLAVRVVVLEGKDPKESFAQPVVAQHMAFAEGVPYFVVVDARGKAVYRGSDVNDALARAQRALK